MSLSETMGEQTDLPAIPSFVDETEPEKKNADLENLPEISAFFKFDSDKGKVPVIEVPERPDEEFQGDLSEAARDILPLIPSVSDLNEIDMLSMPTNANDDVTLLDEEADYLPEIPSVLGHAYRACVKRHIGIDAVIGPAAEPVP